MKNYFEKLGKRAFVLIFVFLIVHGFLSLFTDTFYLTTLLYSSLVLAILPDEKEQ